MRRATVAILVAVVLCGCSDTRRIAGEASRIRYEAQDTISVLEKAKVAEDPLPLIDEAIKNQHEIVKSTEIISQAVANVEDKVAWWQKSLKWGLIASVLALVLGILWYSGLSTLIRSFVGLIVPAVRSRARRAVKLSEGLMSPDEFVAAEREHPALNAAYRLEKKKVKARAR